MVGRTVVKKRTIYVSSLARTRRPLLFVDTSHDNEFDDVIQCHEVLTTRR